MEPKKDIIFELRCAFNSKEFKHKSYVNDGEERVLQFVEGFKSFFYHFNKHVGFYENVYVIDNTVNDKSEVDKRILNAIPSEANIIFSYKKTKNKHGQNNKGAGLIESWEANWPVFRNYKYVFFHEPRQKMLNFNLYKNFLQNPTNTFGKYVPRQFNTGSWFMEIKTLKEYITYRNAESMSENNITIEADLYDFFNGLDDRYKPKGNWAPPLDLSLIKKREYCMLEKINVLWYDQLAKIQREF
tara:strand:+ start:14671 stop:15399 length:729 start_codon:yes stop_codon:yes gene_type:complete